MDKKELMTFMPHRDPMLLVDEAVFEGGEAQAVYHVTGSEYFLQGHFPGNPVVPGVILCEIMAQGCSILIREELVGRTPFFAGIREARFKHPVRPGDVIAITGHITNQRGLTYFIDAQAAVGGRLAAKGTFIFTLVDNSTLHQAPLQS